jgi:serine/threonine protein kinase
MVGRTVLHYQLLEKLGAGGMGEIFKAQDTRLNRYVAIKVLSSTGGGGADTDRRRRFIQEAQAASALNHPNIITIHDIVSEGDAEYMVMEFVAGRTLVDMIPKGGLRAPQVLKYSVQMADALNAAHSAGIIHRDLKPGNVMVTESGLVKILDFGLAKLTDRGPLSQMGGDTNDQTQTIANAPLTVEGSIIGTVSYMSPEQAQGKKVDTRSDIFSFGVVLYEMTTGVRAFPGDSALSTLSAILRDDVKPLLEAAPEAPPQLDKVIQRCLRKNPDERWQTMKDVQGALGALKHDSDSGMLYRARLTETPRQPEPEKLVVAPPIVAPAQSTQEPAKKSSMGTIAAGIGVVLLLAAGFGGWYVMKHRKQPEPVAVQPAVVQPVPQPEPPPVVVPVPEVPKDTALTNDSIIEMVSAKVPVTVILSQMQSGKTNFVMSTEEVIRLSKAGVPANVIEWMRDPKKIPAQPPVTVARAPSTTPTPQTKQLPPPPAAQPKEAQPQATAQPQPPPAPTIPTPSPTRPATVIATITDGQPFSITLAADIPNNVEEGAALHFTVTKDLKVGDQVVIARGTPVTGTIADTGGKRKFGFGGKMSMRVEQTESTGGQRVALRAAPGKRAEGTVRPVDTGKPKPKDMAAAAGTEYIAYIDGEQKVAVRK